ncbi:MAG: cell division protein ZapA [Spiribacter sp.]|jgi:cell division protein ZapA|nr:cell division protein ZapA [Spiribacter sp.]MDR9489852.1 cell division protein ZapA [Spiribacter sp.]
MSEPIKVNILDREFMVAAPAEERDGLLESARQLNTRMQEIRETGKIVGIERIAIMAALNITHEMLQAQDQAAGSQAASDQLTALESRIDDYLQDVDIPAELRRR